MLLPRELDMIAAGKHMPLPVPKPNVAELVELNKQEQGKVDSADEDWRRQVWTRKPAPRDCAIGSGIDCGRELGPLVATSKRLVKSGQGLAGGNQQQQQQQQQQRQRAQSGLQQGGTQRGVPQQKQRAAANHRGPQQKQQVAAEHRGPQQKQQSSTEGRGPQHKQPLQAMGRRAPQPPQRAEERGPQQKQQAPTTDGRGG